MSSRRIGTLFLLLIPALTAVAFLHQQLRAAAVTTTLYDGGLGTRMDAQGEFAYQALNGANPFLTPQATAVFSAPGTLLDTGAEINDFAGFNATPFPLDRLRGFRLSLTMWVSDEHHLSNDRSGVTVILLGADRRGIELAFWENEIWAQEGAAALFTHAEGASFATNGGLVQYDLDIISHTYQLAANGAPLLTGEVRDYTGWSPPPPGLPDPYETANFIFWGDNSSSASGTTLITAVSVTTGTAATAALSPAVITARENEAAAVFTVTLDAAPLLTTTVNFRTSGGTAVAGSDYLAGAGSLLFPPGAQNMTGTVTLLDNARFAYPRTIGLQLTGVENGLLGNESAIITLLDDELPLFLPFLRRGNGP